MFSLLRFMQYFCKKIAKNSQKDTVSAKTTLPITNISTSHYTSIYLVAYARCLKKLCHFFE